MGDSRLSRVLLLGFTALAVIFLFAPIAVMIIFSFNDPAGRQNITWQGFTIRNYFDIWSRPQITGPMVTSLALAAISTVLATAFGTMIALALARYQFRGRSLLNLLIFVPMTAPEIILGASLLTLWISIGTPRGFLTILVAHVMFNISYVVVTVRARLVGFNRSLEEAGMDLYASRWQAFWRVTFTLSLPGVVAGSLLTFIPAIGDFINAEIIGAGNPEVQMIGNIIQFKYINANDYPAAAALSFVLVVGVTLLVAGYSRVFGTDRLTT